MNQQEPYATPHIPTTFVDLAFIHSEHAAELLLAAVPEVRSVAIMFDWEVPLSEEIPPGLTFTKGPDGKIKEVQHPLALFGLIRQNARMGISLLARYQKLLSAVDKMAQAMATTINERQSQLDALKRQIETAQGQLADLGSKPAAEPGTAEPAPSGRTGADQG